MRKTLSAGIQYFDRTVALLDGRVDVDDVMFAHVLPDVAVRGLHSGAFDIAEIPLAHYAFLRGQGEPFVGLPVFTDRLMLHRYVWARVDSGIAAIEDLLGSRVIVPKYFMTSSIWQRGLLETVAGISPERMAWRTTAPERDARLVVPPGVSVEVLEGRSHLGMDALLGGEGDVLMTEGTPLMSEEERALVVPLSDVVRQAQREWYVDRRLHPIAHVIAISEAVATARPEILTALQRGFDLAKQSAYYLLENERIVSLPDFRGALDEARHRYGSDPWPYGVGGDNLAQLELFLDFAYGQGLTPRRLELTDLFPPEVTAYEYTAALRYGADLHHLSSLRGRLL
jgi:4,5-dihydroxyphthalate decarboxylase